MSSQPQNVAGQPAGSPQAQQGAQAQAVNALNQFGQQHGLSNVDWGALLALLVQAVQLVRNSSGQQPTTP